MNSTPSVLVLAPPRYIGPLGVMRTLSEWNVPVYLLAYDGPSEGNSSRYRAVVFRIGRGGSPTEAPARDLDDLLRAGRTLGEGSLLLAGSDEWALFVAEHADKLAGVFRFPRMPLVHDLASKDGLYRLATEHG